MIKKEEVISFAWQHILLLVSLYVMTFGVAACVRSQLGSSVISTIPYVMASAGKMLDYIPGWTIGGYTIMMNAIFVVLQILILRRNFEWVQLFQLVIGTLFAMVYVGVTVRLFNKHLAWFDRLLHYRPGCRRYVYGLARYIRRQI